MLGQLVFMETRFTNNILITMITSISHAWTACVYGNPFTNNILVTMITSISHDWTACVYGNLFLVKT